jgi:hypothetical protein
VSQRPPSQRAHILDASLFDISSAGRKTITKIVGAKSTSGAGLNRDDRRLVAIATGAMNAM